MTYFNTMSERSYDYKLVNLSTGAVADRALRSPNEAADSNWNYRQINSNLRWIPA